MAQEIQEKQEILILWVFTQLPAHPLARSGEPGVGMTAPGSSAGSDDPGNLTNNVQPTQRLEHNFIPLRSQAPFFVQSQHPCKCLVHNPWAHKGPNLAWSVTKNAVLTPALQPF